MAKYQDRDWLYNEYVEKERRPKEIAEECGVTTDTIYRWRDKHDLPKVDHTSYVGKSKEKYHEEEWLREQYWGKKLTMTEIGEKCGVEGETIRKWLEKNGIETRDQSEATKLEWEGADERRQKQAEWMSEQRRGNHASIFTRRRGYVYAGCGVCDDQVAMHRLLAVAEYGFDAVKDMDVHHKNGVPWDNRPENIELLSRSEHQSLHMAERV